MKKHQIGFTIIELITVIILIGILAVAVLPKFDGTASYEAHSHRTQLISALRLTQQRAMQQTSPDMDLGTGDAYCHHIVFDSSEPRYGVPNRLDCDDTDFTGWDAENDPTGHQVETRYDITFSIAGSANKLVSFNWLGQPNDCDDNGVAGCTIDVGSAVETLKIVIENEGYIHAQ